MMQSEGFAETSEWTVEAGIVFENNQMYLSWRLDCIVANSARLAAESVQRHRVPAANCSIAVVHMD